MKLIVGLAMTAFAASGLAAECSSKKSVLVSYGKEETDGVRVEAVMKDAKQTITNDGGEIGYEYTIVPGFSASACEESLRVIEEEGKGHDIVVEDDQTMTTAGVGI